MGMNTNPYTITTTMGGGGGQLNHYLQRAEDEKLNVDDLITDQKKTNFLEQGGVTWGHNMPDTDRGAYTEQSRILDQIHIGVFGACRILLRCVPRGSDQPYISSRLLAELCQNVSKVALLSDADNSRVIYILLKFLQ